MNVIILAAGYATRLGELTRNFPKPLLEVGGRTILDHLLDRICEIPDLGEIYLVTNSRFANHFREWKKTRVADSNVPLQIVDDGTSTNENRLGAIGDIRFAMQACEDIGGNDLLVCASDNILEFSLANFVTAVQRRRTAGICVRKIEDLSDLRRRGVAELDENDNVIRFLEKPENPPSQWAAPPIYYYPADVLPRIGEYLEAGENADAPGHFIEWLCSIAPIIAYRAPGDVVDIGNPDSLAKARRRYGDE